MDSSYYSMDSKRLFTAKQCLFPLEKQGASMNGYIVWIFSFYPNFFRDDFYAEKVDGLGF